MEGVTNFEKNKSEERKRESLESIRLNEVCRSSLTQTKEFLFARLLRLHL